MQPQPKAPKKLTTLFAMCTRRKPKQQAKLQSKKAQGTWLLTRFLALDKEFETRCKLSLKTPRVAAFPK